MVEEERKLEPWKNDSYWKLPEMVRNAIDQDAGGSQFGNKLDTLNDHLTIYKSVFYKKKPSFEQNFIQRQKDALLK